MKRVLVFLSASVFLAVSASAQMIIDHTCVEISAIPTNWIGQARQDLHIAYGHTSHGSQLTDGMVGLIAFANGGGKGLTVATDFFDWNNGGTGGALDLHDYAMGGDVGYYPAWVNNTRTYLDDPANSDVNVIMWSWCGQVDDKYSAGTLTNEYLTPMAQLELDYPDVTFIYMTGHVDINDDADNKAANNAIREYCQTHGKVLYDFADIEHYDPDDTYFEFVNDNCNYYASAGGSSLGNWATEWRATHVEDVDWYDCGSAHSDALNANQKAYAAWHMFARLAGWQQVQDTTPPSVPQNLHTVSVGIGVVELAWDPSSDPESGISQYRILRNGSQLTTSGITGYTDSTAVPGTTNDYAVAAVNGSGLVATSTVISVIVPVDEEDPTVPTRLSAEVVSDTQVNLSWTASSDNVAVAGYRIFRDGSEIDTSTTTSYSDTEVVGKTQYSYSVSAYDASGNESIASASVSVTTPLVDNEAPTIPIGLGIISTDFSEVVIGWSASSDNVAVIGYRIFRDGSELDTTAGTSFTDGTVLDDTTYEYRVTAFDGSGNESAQSGILTVTTPDDGGVTYYTNVIHTISEVVDTFIFESDPDDNYGSDPYEGSTDRFLVRFDLPSSMDGCRIISAELAFFVWNQSNYQSNQFMTVHRVTSPWDESYATWNSRESGITWDTPGGDFDAEVLDSIEHQEGQANWDHVLYPAADVRYQVQKWVCAAEENYGFMLINDSLTGIGIKASEYSSHGHLEIIWSDEPAPYLYECWQTNYFDLAEMDDPLISGPDADPDGDGIANGFEHALGTDPRGVAPSSFGLIPDNCISNIWNIRYQRADNVDGYVFDVLACEELGAGWTPLSPLLYSSSISNLTAETEEVCLGLDLAVQTNRFFRLELREE